MKFSFYSAMTRAGIGLMLAFAAAGSHAAVDPARMAMFSDRVYERMTPADQYGVLNKFLATLYKGIAAKEFFNLSKGLATPAIQTPPVWISAYQTRIQQPLSAAERNAALARVNSGKYVFNSYRGPIEKIMATLWEMPLSRDYFLRWIAYALMNTRLFAGSIEMATTYPTDVAITYDHLVGQLEQQQGFEQMVYAYLTSQESWRRFRSPEDHVRETMEIFLNHHNDSDVQKAAKACQNWYLTLHPELKLTKGPNVNTEPQYLLGRTIVHCEDFYHAVVIHPNFKPTIVRQIVDYFLGGLPDTYRAEFKQAVLATQTYYTFEWLIYTIINSHAYLLDVERPAWFEEIFFNLADRFDLKAGTYLFLALDDNYLPGGFPSMYQMNQPPMFGKLGRESPPTDAGSFAHLHRYIREEVLINAWPDQLLVQGTSSGWPVSVATNIPGNDETVINYFFLNGIGRTASIGLELPFLKNILARKWSHYKTLVVTDYLSRLPELYVLRAFSAGGVQ